MNLYRKRRANSSVGTSTSSTRLPRQSVVDISPAALASAGHRAKTAMQRKLLSAAQSREANMAVILVSSVSMFLICHLPRLFVVV